MIKSSAKTTVKFDNISWIKKAMEIFAGAYVTVGIHEDAGRYTEGNNPPTVVEVALWNEFGTRDIPERSFFRSTLDEHEGKINEWREEALSKVAEKKMTVPQALEMLGFRIQTLIQNKIKSNVPPPLAESTSNAKKNKGSANWNRTLMDTELMLRSITYKVVV